MAKDERRSITGMSFSPAGEKVAEGRMRGRCGEFAEAAFD